MWTIIFTCLLVYYIYKTIVSGREYFKISGEQNDLEHTKEIKKARKEFIESIAGAVIFFFALL